MKLFLSAIIFTFFFAFIDGRALSGAAIKAKWGIGDPTTVYNSVTNTFIMTYPGTSAGGNDGTDGIEASNFRVSYYDKNCKDPAAGTSVYKFEANQGISKPDDFATLPDPFIEDGKPKVEFRLNPKDLANDDNIYTLTSTANGDEGAMVICARMSVGYTDDDNEDFKEINFIQSIITIKYVLKDGIVLSEFNVAPKDKDTATGSKDPYAVTAFLCDPPTVADTAANTIPSVQGVVVFKQGSLVTVCVAPGVASLADGIVMKSINDFTWKRTDDDTIQQIAIVGDVAAANGLTSLACTAQDPFCYFSSVLSADFYKKSGSVKGSGSATMEFGSSVGGGGSSPSSLLPIASYDNEFDREACGCTGEGDGPLEKVPATSNDDYNNEEFRTIVDNYIANTDKSENSSRNRFGGKISCWDVSLVTNMYQAFRDQNTFNEPLGCWNTESVTKMSQMFYGATVFNQDIGKWSVSLVTDMNRMFTYASSFNQDIGEWSVSLVTNMSYMFYKATAFNQDIGKWSVLLVTNIHEMFYGATAFNQNLCPWDIQATNTNTMFSASGCSDKANPTNSNKCQTCTRRLTATTTATATATTTDAAGKPNKPANNNNKNNNNKNDDRNIVSGRVLQEGATAAATAAAATSSEFDISIGVSKSDNNNDGVGALRTAAAGGGGGDSLGMMTTTALVSLFGGLIGSALLFV